MADSFAGFRLLTGGSQPKRRRSWKECAFDVGRNGGTYKDVQKVCTIPKSCTPVKRRKGRKGRR